MKQLVTWQDLVEKLGLKPYTAKTIIRTVKLDLASKGFELYTNRRLGTVPWSEVKRYLNIQE